MIFTCEVFDVLSLPDGPKHTGEREIIITNKIRAIENRLVAKC